MLKKILLISTASLTLLNTDVMCSRVFNWFLSGVEKVAKVADETGIIDMLVEKAHEQEIGKIKSSISSRKSSIIHAISTNFGNLQKSITSGINNLSQAIYISAIKNGFTEVVMSSLDDKKFEITITDENKNNAWHFAAKTKNSELINKLSSHQYIGNLRLTKNNEGETPLHIAFKNKDEAFILKNISLFSKIKNQESALSKVGRATSKIFSSSTDIDTQDNDGNTVLHLAMNNLSKDIHDNVDVVLESLLGLEPIITIKNNEGKTPICLAIDKEFYKTAKLLIEKTGSNIDLLGTPLKNALSKDSKEITKQILEQVKSYSSDSILSPLESAIKDQDDSKESVKLVREKIDALKKQINEEQEKKDKEYMEEQERKEAEEARLTEQAQIVEKQRLAEEAEKQRIAEEKAEKQRQEREEQEKREQSQKEWEALNNLVKDAQEKKAKEEAEEAEKQAKQIDEDFLFTQQGFGD